MFCFDVLDCATYAFRAGVIWPVQLAAWLVVSVGTFSATQSLGAPKPPATGRGMLSMSGRRATCSSIGTVSKTVSAPFVSVSAEALQEKLGLSRGSFGAGLDAGQAEDGHRGGSLAAGTALVQLRAGFERPAPVQTHKSRIGLSTAISASPADSATPELRAVQFCL